MNIEKYVYPVFMEQELKKQLKVEFNKGKNKVACVIDAIFLWVILFIGLFFIGYLLKMPLLGLVILAATISMMSGIVWGLVKKYRFEGFIEKKITAAKEELLLENFVMMPKKKRQVMLKKILALHLNLSEPLLFPKKNGYSYKDVFCYLCLNHPKYEVGVETAVRAIESAKQQGYQQVIIISAAEFDEHISVFANRKQIQLIGRKEILEAAKKMEEFPKKEEAERYLLAEIAERKKRMDQVKKTFFDTSKSKPFFLCAILLAVWPFFTGFHIIYPIMAFLSGGFSIFLFFKKYRESRVKM